MSTSLIRRLRSICSVRAFVILGLAAFISITLPGGGRAQSEVSLQSGPSAALSTDSLGLIDATIVDLQGSIATTSGGISIDIAVALVGTVAGMQVNHNAIKIGSRIRASVEIPADPTLPFLARFVQLRSDNEMILVTELEGLEFNDGLLSGIRAAHRRFLISGGTFFDFGPGYKKLKVGRTITIAAILNDNGDFIATRVYINSRSADIGAGIF